ncbi:MAG: hypothetical protein ACRCTZ_19350 [Sarcina sp.]
MNDFDSKDLLTVKELSFICKYKFNSKLSEMTIKNHIYKSIKSGHIKAISKDNKTFVSFGEFIDFLSKNYSKLGFSYNPIIH